VTYNAKPLQDGAVIFMPTDRGKSVWGAGHINPDGRFTISAYLKDTPIEPGQYTIFFRPPPPTVLPTAKRYERLDEEQDAKKAETVQPALASPSFPLPERYLTKDSSGLSFNFDGRPQRIDFDLKD